MKKISYAIALLFVIILAASLVLQFMPSRQPEPSTASNLQVTFLDIGQADSTLIQCNGSSMLIDAGTNNTADKLVNTFKSERIRKFEVVVGTHPHEDHIGGLDAVISNFDISKIYLPRVSTTTRTFIDMMQAIQSKGLSVTDPQPGASFNLGSAACTILAPILPVAEDDLNNYSIVIRLLYGSVSFLFAGDAQAESEKKMLAGNFTLKSDVLKVGHHGSNSSTTPDFLKAVSPRYAVIMVGAKNDYGHPHQETLDRLNKAGVTIYRTDLNGNIKFISDGSNLTVKSEK
jgi:competence protein ComEC